ncbi:MAG: hypothetical protein IJ979_05365, partial [Tidjanibacter sp.]|nr:hypothetical protein [Tidjanibacter sp.]
MIHTKFSFKRLLATSLIALTALSLNACMDDKVSTPNNGANIVSGVDNIQIKKILEDESGMLYMISDFGLFCYDGTNYLRYTSSADSTSLSANTINDILIDNKGDVWLATQKGVDRLDSSTHKFDHYNIDDYNSYTLRMLEDNQGRLFALTRNGIFLLDTTRSEFKRVISLDSGIDFSLSSKVFIDRIGQIWIMGESTIEVFDSNFNYQGKYDLGGYVATAIYDGASNLYLVNRDRIRRFDLASAKLSDNVGRLETINPRQIMYISALGSNQ